MQQFLAKIKPFLLPLLICVCLLIIILIIAYTLALSKKTTPGIPESPQPSKVIYPTGSLGQKYSVKELAPADGNTLKAGQPQTFKVYFNNFVLLSQISVNLLYADLTQDNPATPIGIDLKALGNNAIQITTHDLIKERSEYQLVIKDQTGNVVFSADYLSNEIPPTPVPSNNPTLKDYLPYETPNYALEYLPSQNLYVFHFKYDSNLETTPDRQFENAKADAIRFIQNKGIDQATVTIEWKNS